MSSRTSGFVVIALALLSPACDHASPAAAPPRVIVAVSPRSFTFTGQNQVAQFSAVVSAAVPVSPKVTWTSSNPVVASVDSLGDVVAHAAGTTTIRATAVADTSAHDDALVTANLHSFPSIP